jgi:ion channel
VLSKLLIALCLMALCVAIHAAGVTATFGWLRRQSYVVRRFWHWTWLFIEIAAWIIVLHLGEISVWAFFYFLTNVITDLQSAFYFSAVTYTTTGYGDVVLPEEWRLVGGVEALTGILLCGWSTGFFFAVVSRMYDAQARQTRSS